MAELIQERYKIEYRITESEDYVAYRGVDIEDREKKVYLLNVYSGSNAKKFVKVFLDLKNCPEYKGLIVEEGCLIAVFDYRSGEKIVDVFKKNAHRSEEYRLKSAGQLLNIGLIAESYPDEIRKRMINYKNFCVKASSERIDINFMLEPETYNNDYLQILINCLRVILPRSFSEPEKEREFFLDLKKRPVKDGIELYARWKKAFPDIESEYHKQINMPFIERFLSLLAINIKWFFKDLFGGRG